MKSWSRLWEDLEIGYLDRELLPILICLNADKNIYTLSSCSGRVVLADSSYPWSREETSVVFKKHGPLKLDELLNAVKKRVVRRLWISVSGPILHLSVNSLKYARLALRIARESGLKHSGVISINKYKGYVLELMSGVKISHLIKTTERAVTDLSELEALVEVINSALAEGRRSVEKLREAVFEELPLEEDLEILSDIDRRGLRVELCRQ